MSSYEVWVSVSRAWTCLVGSQFAHECGIYVVVALVEESHSSLVVRKQVLEAVLGGIAPGDADGHAQRLVLLVVVELFPFSFELGRLGERFLVQ